MSGIPGGITVIQEGNNGVAQGKTTSVAPLFFPLCGNAHKLIMRKTPFAKKEKHGTRWRRYSGATGYRVFPHE
ncbi:hypothetical protein [Parasegetibacter sp. NRK P23]|uniref:hypothetical protein n=1 Tax=Parasegetibacter sp. NRK P23 TaxID=2942999 RepID=UPI002043B8FC|nr:hypothetical protein [Parasegetibacter sp. NRK P23]MCM5527938.1 hypothetical protein [Parasegetibacter sp. NRK P23]